MNDSMTITYCDKDEKVRIKMRWDECCPVLRIIHRYDEHLDMPLSGDVYDG